MTHAENETLLLSFSFTVCVTVHGTSRTVGRSFAAEICNCRRGEWCAGYKDLVPRCGGECLWSIHCACARERVEGRRVGGKCIL